MYITEMFAFQTPIEYRSEDEDNSVLRGLKDMRKTRLTLAQINKMRVMNDLRRYERQKEIEKIKNQYGSTPEEAEL